MSSRFAAARPVSRPVDMNMSAWVEPSDCSPRPFSHSEMTIRMLAQQAMATAWRHHGAAGRTRTRFRAERDAAWVVIGHQVARGFLDLPGSSGERCSASGTRGQHELERRADLAVSETQLPAVPVRDIVREREAQPIVRPARAYRWLSTVPR